MWICNKCGSEVVETITRTLEKNKKCFNEYHRYECCNSEKCGNYANIDKGEKLEDIANWKEF